MKSEYLWLCSTRLGRDLIWMLAPRLNKLLGNVIISQGGVVPHIAAELRKSPHPL